MLRNLDKIALIGVLLSLGACNDKLDQTPQAKTAKDKISLETSIIVLGNVQDGGAPHMGCNKECCKDLFDAPNPDLQVVSLGLVDRVNRKKYIFEATPDFVRQTKKLKHYADLTGREVPDGIFLTHAHIGHYTGLMYLGKEAMNTDKVQVFAMPRMKAFLEQNGPWSQLVDQKNIQLRPLVNRKMVELTDLLKVKPFRVPHRDEFSETVGFIIQGPHKKALFIPDIDKWSKWPRNIIDEIAKVDYAFIDATFYSGTEINNRDISEIPHPFIIESMDLFKHLTPREKSKVYFIHLNHTNPALVEDSPVSKLISKKGFHVARMGAVFGL